MEEPGFRGGIQFLAVDASKLRVLVIGGGRAGAGRALRLASRGARVVVASLEFSGELVEAWRRGLVELVRADAGDSIVDALMEWANLVVVAVPDAGLARRLAERAEALGKLVSVATTGVRGNAVMPFQGEGGGLAYAVTSLGASGLAARRALELIGERVAGDPEVRCLLRVHGEVKRRLIEGVGDHRARMRVHEALWRDPEFRALCREGREREALERALRLAAEITGVQL